MRFVHKSSTLIMSAHRWLASEPSEEHKRNLCKIATWGLLEISGIVLAGMVVAPALYALVIHNKVIATIGAAVVLAVVNLVYLLVQELAKIWGFKTGVIYYYPLFALLSVPLTILAINWAQNCYKEQFDEFFRD